MYAKISLMFAMFGAIPVPFEFLHDFSISPAWSDTWTEDGCVISASGYADLEHCFPTNGS